MTHEYPEADLPGVPYEDSKLRQHLVAERRELVDRQRAESRTKWEYLTVSPWENRSLNDYGAEGWELVTADRGYMWFKRPLITDEVK